MERFKKIIILTFLVLVGLGISVVCFEEVNPTSLLRYHEGAVYTSYTARPITTGQFISGILVATENNLGMVKLRINTFRRMNTTHIIFSLRKKGQSQWTVTNTYTVDRFPGGLLYPFGFPAIADSKGKVYEFKLASVDGSTDNAIGVERGYHDVVSQYVFQKSALLGNTRLLQTFLLAKMNSIVTDPYTVAYLGIFLVPALVYICKKASFLAVGYMFFTYTYLPVSMHSNTILFIAGTTLCTAYVVRIRSSIIFAGGLIWLTQIPISLVFGNQLSADRAATLIFFLVLIGVIMSLKESNK